MRIIARLDIKNDHVIKGIQLEGLRKVGDPSELSIDYYNAGADELLFMDAVATLYGRHNLFTLINNLCSEIFIPVTVGGGIRSVKDAEFALLNGADRVAINTAAVGNIKLIEDIAKNFGVQAVVGSIEAKLLNSLNVVYTHNGREPTKLLVTDWAKRLEAAGCGEILITSIDRDGTKKGYDSRLNDEICSAVSCPVVCSGGFGRLEHLDPILKSNALSGIAVGTVLHYGIENINSIREYIESSEAQIAN